MGVFRQRDGQRCRRRVLADTGYQGPTEAYTLVDGVFGVHSTDRTMTVGVRGSNLLNKSVQQHVFGDLIGRTVTGEVRFDF